MRRPTLSIPADGVRLGYAGLSIWDVSSKKNLPRGLPTKTPAALPQRPSRGGRDNRLEPFPRPSPGRTRLHGEKDVTPPGWTRRGDRDSWECSAVPIRQWWRPVQSRRWYPRTGSRLASSTEKRETAGNCSSSPSPPYPPERTSERVSFSLALCRFFCSHHLLTKGGESLPGLPV
jgi:hypothetical protein